MMKTKTHLDLQSVFCLVGHNKSSEAFSKNAHGSGTMAT
jgi:hypothetical protein